MKVWSGRSDALAELAAIRRSQAVIEFQPDGTIISANENFCKTMGYTLDEIVGRHHRIFVDPNESAGADYQAFWARLRDGTFDRRQYRRIAKGGREVWIEASYNPVMRGGRTIKIVKYATDITASKYKSLEDASKLDAVSGSMAVIEFTPDGTILTANENFCAAVGYTLEDIKGRHHRIFCDPSYVSTPQYAKFWQDLAGGHGSKGEFRRIGKGGKDVWIQACYNPVFNGEGKVYKVIKLATDLTERMNALSKVANAIRAVSEGDLSIQLSESFVPTMEALRKDFNVAVEVLAQTMTSVRDSSEALLSSTNEIKESAADLSHRTEAQAAAVEEAAAALEEITTTVGDSAKRGDEVGQLMDGARKQAVVSSEIVGQAIRAMGEIEQSSKQISKILGVIDNIAFQTNLLALNAGVEAARAGDAGKGFAVVAQEVRDLAQRSGEAAKEIRKLISLSDNQVSRGVGLVGQTGEALNAILSQVTAISDNVNAIAASTREQSNALGEINASVGSIDQENQKNAAMVEETTAATFSLGQEIQNLFDLVGRFRLGGDRTQPAAYRAAS